MSCQQFWNTMPRDDAAHPHLAECPKCAARMARGRELAKGLRAVAEDLDRLQAPTRVEARLLTAFRAQAGIAEPALTRRRWIPVLTWAAAFAAMLAVGVLVVRERQPEARRPAPARVIEVAEVLAGDDASDDGFVALPGADQLPPADDLSVVHVELPRSAMMRVGIEVSPERAAERIQADVKVGSDGLARAVRFVEATGSD